MKPILVLIFAFTVLTASAQKENIPTTESFSIEGKVKKSLTLSLADLPRINLRRSTVLLLRIILEKEEAV